MIEYPTIVLPWNLVQHSNHRLMPSKRGGLFMSPLYRQAKESAELSIKRQWRGMPKLEGTLELYARCFFPDRRKRDAVGYAKLIDDALTGIAFVDDSQLYRETWERSGVDHENPRIEIRLSEFPLSPLSPSGHKEKEKANG